MLMEWHWVVVNFIKGTTREDAIAPAKQLNSACIAQVDRHTVSLWKHSFHKFLRPPHLAAVSLNDKWRMCRGAG